MAKKRSSFGLNDVFPISEGVTSTALSTAFPLVEEEVKSVIGDIGRTYATVPIDKIVPNPFQPRKQFDQQRLVELAASLQTEGMLEPMLVRSSPTQPGMYEIAAGERRWRAAKLAGWTECPAEILEACPDSRMKRIALLENIQREQLTPLELAEVYDALLQERDEQGNAVYTVRSLAEILNKNKDHVDEHRALLRVPPDVRQLIEEDPDIPLRIIRELGNIENVADRMYLNEEVRARNLKTADIIAILHRQRKTRQEKVFLTPVVPLSSSTSFSQTQDSSNEESPLTQGEQQKETHFPKHSGTTIVAEHERSLQKPSSVITLAVLDRKLHKDQTLLEKIVTRITEELEAMDAEEKEIIRKYLQQWRDRLQQTIEIL